MSLFNDFDFYFVIFYYFLYCIFFFFFFSSRRRHTRLTCDWSSDVCSSDLIVVLPRTPLFDAFVSNVDGPGRVAAGDTIRLTVSYGVAGMRDARSGMREDRKSVV